MGRVDLALVFVEIGRDDGRRVVAVRDGVQYELERLRLVVIDELRLGDAERELALSDLEHIVARRAVAVVALVGDELLICVDEVVSGVLFERVDEAHVVGVDVDRGRPAGGELALADRPIRLIGDVAEGTSVDRQHAQHGAGKRLVVELFGVDGVCVHAALIGDVCVPAAGHCVLNGILDLSAGGKCDVPCLGQRSRPLDGVGLIGLSAIHVQTFAGRAAVVVRPKYAARIGRSGIGDLQAGQRTDRAGLVLERDLSGALVRGCVDRGGSIARVGTIVGGGCGVAVPIEVGDRAAFARTDQHILTADIVFGGIFYGSAGRGAGIVGQHTVDRGDAARRARRAECQRLGIGRRNGDAHQSAGSCNMFFLIECIPKPMVVDICPDSCAALQNDVVHRDVLRDRNRAAGGASRIAVVNGFVNTVAYDIDVCAEVERKVADRAPERICRNAAKSKRAMSGGTVTGSFLCSGDGSRDIERAIVDRGVVHRAEQAADEDAVVLCAVDHFLRFGDVHIEVLHRRAASGVGERARQRQIADLSEIGRVRSNAGMSERVYAAALFRVFAVPLVIDLERDVGAAAVQRRLKDAVHTHI